MSENDSWYPGKYMGKVVDGAWETTKAVGRNIREHPVAGTVGAAGGFIVAGPVGAIGGAAAMSGLAKATKKRRDARAGEQ